MLMTYLVRAAKATSVAAAATLAAWWLFRSMYTLINHATEADSERNPLAGVPYYLAANAAGIAFQPFALWAGLRLSRVHGNHLAITISAYVWSTMTAGHLVDSTPGPWEALLWVAVQSAVTTGSSLLQARLMPTSTQRSS